MTSAPKPSNWREIVDAYDYPFEFARLCNDYYAEVAAQRAVEARDFTEPIHQPENAEEA